MERLRDELELAKRSGAEYQLNVTESLKKSFKEMVPELELCLEDIVKDLEDQSCRDKKSIAERRAILEKMEEFQETWETFMEDE